MLTISLDDALAARVEAALPAAKIADANAFAVAAIKAALVRLERTDTQSTKRGTPLAQFIDEQRIKHGLPEDWGTGSEKYAMTEAHWALLDSVADEFVTEPETPIK